VYKTKETAQALVFDVGVNVPDDTLLISRNGKSPLEILTLISTLWPLLIVSCGGEAETEGE